MEFYEKRADADLHILNAKGFTGIESGSGKRAYLADGVNLAHGGLPDIEAAPLSSSAICAVSGTPRDVLAVGNDIYSITGSGFYKNGVFICAVSENALISDFSGKLMIIPDMIYYDIATGASEALSYTQSFSGSIRFTRAYAQGYNNQWNKGPICDMIILPAALSGALRYGDIINIYSTDNFVSSGGGSSSTMSVNEDIVINTANSVYIKVPLGTFPIIETVNDDVDDEHYGWVAPCEAVVSNLVITRRYPVISSCCQWGGRLFGVAGGKIYASRKGVPEVWLDSYGERDSAWSYVSETAGNFTACAACGGYALFFKENEIYKLYGDDAYGFKVSKIAASGVTAGNARSVGSYNDEAFYFTSGGVMSYNGGKPRLISEGVKINGTGAFGCCAGGKYYLCVSSGGEKKVFGYDAVKRSWLRESGFTPYGFCAYGGGAAYIASDGVFVINGGSSYAWSAEIAFESEVTRRMNARKIRIRVAGGSGNLKAEVSFGGSFIEMPEITAVTAGNYSFILPRCIAHRVVLRLSGEGSARISEAALEYYDGGMNYA